MMDCAMQGAYWKIQYEGLAMAFASLMQITYSNS